MTSLREPILLLSGAGLPVWIWDQVRKELAASHQTVVAERPRHDRASLMEYATAALDSAPWERFAVVAHSSGGTLAAQAITLAPDRVGAFLAVAAVVPKPGHSFLASMPLPNRLMLSLAMRLAGTRPPNTAIRRSLASHVDTETADRIVTDFHPEAVRLYRDRLQAGGFPERRGYLVTSQDASLPNNLQQRFASNLGASWNETLDSGHLPMLEAPDALARQIKGFLAH